MSVARQEKQESMDKNIKMRIGTEKIITVILRTIFFFAFLAAWVQAFSGVKYLFVRLGAGKPFEFQTAVVLLIALLVYTVVFGRFFCGKACAFGAYGDLIRFIYKKVYKVFKRKLPKNIPETISRKLRFVKYGVLALICLLCYLGYSTEITAASPWTGFSRIIELDIKPDDHFGAISVIIFGLCTLGMAFEDRFFCKVLCPLGAVFTLMPMLPFSVIKRNRALCISGCSACKKACPVSLDIPFTNTAASDQKPQEKNRMGECFQCGKCTRVCPRNTAGCSTVASGKRGIALDCVKYMILGGIIYILTL